MTKLFFIIYFILIPLTFNAFGQNVKSAKTTLPLYSIEYQDDDSLVILFSFHPKNYKYKSVDNKKVSGVFLDAPGSSKIMKKGAPDLLKFSKSIIINDINDYSITILKSDYIEIDSIDFLPSKGSITRDGSPNEVPYFYGNEYNENKFFPGNTVTLGDPYIFRDYKGQTVHFFPLQYNPVTKKLRIFSAITASISNKYKSKIILKSSESNINQEFASIYQNHFLNYSQLKSYTPIEDEGSMLIIAHPLFMETMKPFIEWKMQKGMNVEMVDATKFGSKDKIMSYVAEYYLTKGLTFLLLVGDSKHVPPYYKSGYSDAAYGHILGKDSYAEVIVGRFSGETVKDIKTQVDRTIAYEKTPTEGTDWYKKGTLIASEQGVGDDDEYDYEHMIVIKDKLLKYNYIQIDEFYDGSQDGGDLKGNPTSQMVINAFNDGRGLLNYIGHGRITYFTTSKFSIDDIPSLTNVNKFPFIFDVACDNGAFVNQTCLAEGLLRAQTNNSPTGAIAMLASTIEQEWDPPMAAHDEMIDIIVESYENNIKRTFGGIAVNGCMLMNDEYPELGPSMTDTWVIFGDPSLSIRTDIPRNITATHQKEIKKDNKIFEITCNSENSTACLMMKGEKIGKTKIKDGKANFILPELNYFDTLSLIVTNYNSIPYIAQIPVFVSDSAYIVFNGFTINDSLGNNNKMAESDEIITINLDLINQGRGVSDSMELILSNLDQNIELLDSTEILTPLTSNIPYSVQNIFKIKVKKGIQNRQKADLKLKMINSKDSVTIFNFYLRLYAPTLKLFYAYLNDTIGNGNNRIDTDETVKIVLTARNLGGVNSQNAECYLYLEEPSIRGDKVIDNIGVINPGNKKNATFTISIPHSMPKGNEIKMKAIIVAGNYTDTLDIIKKVDVLVEDWETGDFSLYKWEKNKTPHWLITDTLVFNNKFSVESPDIDDLDSSSLILKLNIQENDSICFYNRTSTETDYDFLKFYINDTLQAQWSGETDWNCNCFFVKKGIQKFTWTYSKDFVRSKGLDKVWIDDISFPNHKKVNVPPYFITNPDTICYVDNKYFYKIKFDDFNIGDSARLIFTQLPNWLSLGEFTDNEYFIKGTHLKTDTVVYHVKLLISDGNDTTSLNFPIWVYPELSITNSLQTSDIQIFPNPAKDIIYLSSRISNDHITYIKLINSVSNQVYNLIPQNSSNQLFTINLPAGIAPGLYFLQVNTMEQQLYRKVIITKQ